VTCWGQGQYGQIGNGSTANRSTPVYVTQLDDAVSIGIGRYHACALKTGGAMRCWGRNGSYELGDNSRTQRNAPVTVAGFTDFDSFAVDHGARNTCALRNQGEARCWGYGATGALGEGTGSTSGKVLVKTLNDAGQQVPLSNLTAIAAMGEHTCAIDSDDRVWCWGQGASGQLGDGLTGGVSLVPFNVLPLY